MTQPEVNLEKWESLLEDLFLDNPDLAIEKVKFVEKSDLQDFIQQLLDEKEKEVKEKILKNIIVSVNIADEFNDEDNSCRIFAKPFEFQPENDGTETLLCDEESRNF